jgi:hypothetical protein
MPATLLGTVGSWGIASDETGLIVEQIDDVSRNEKSYLKDKSGCRIGRADYDESVEIDVKGKLTAASPWSQKIAAALTIANTITSGHLQTASTGQTLVGEVARTRNQEDWRGLSFKAEMLPFFPGA